MIVTLTLWLRRRADQAVSHAATVSQTGCHGEDPRNRQVESDRAGGQWSEW